MRNEFKYQLESGSKKHYCPRCSKKRYVRYKNSETNEYMEVKFGRCDREVNCGYHLNPYHENLVTKDHTVVTGEKPVQTIIDTIDWKRVTPTLQHRNNLTEFLYSKFDAEGVARAIELYMVGTSKKWKGATIFWQVDHQSKVRTGKIMLYDACGKRVKKPQNHIGWVHSELHLKNFNLKQCFFGEHLLQKFPDKTVAIVESEKTAIIASMQFPDFIWLASGSKTLHQLKPCSTLFPERHVVLFPDLGAFDDWNQKATLVNAKSTRVADILEKYACDNERQQGLDLADYILQSKTNPNATHAKHDFWLGMNATEALQALGGAPII
jgi:hypothetical protein